MAYTHFEIDRMLDSMTVLVDTREQNTPALRRRLEGLKSPFRRQKLEYGDYAPEIVLPSGKAYSLQNRLCVERKMGLDELCMCFTSQRDRFQREFERSTAGGAKIYLLVEDADWERLLSGKYRSRMRPDALAASLLAWSERYNIVPVFCKAETSGKMIYKLLRYGVKHILETEEVGTEWDGSS